jgi:plasmid stability protein
MPDLLVRDLDPETYDRLRKTAEAQGKSLAQTVREMLIERLSPSKDEIWERARRLREKIGRVSEDSTKIIREWRDNDEPYR